MTSELYCCLWRFLGKANTDQGCCFPLRICNGLFTFQGGMSRVKRIILCLYLTWPKINSNFDLSNSESIENCSSEIMAISKYIVSLAFIFLCPGLSVTCSAVWNHLEPSKYMLLAFEFESTRQARLLAKLKLLKASKWDAYLVRGAVVYSKAASSFG